MPRAARSSKVKSEVLSSSVTPSRAIIAAARNFSKDPVSSTSPGKRLEPQDWHKLAWEFYDNVGEYRYAIDWKANLLARAKLQVRQNGAEVTDQDVLDVLDALFDGAEGQSDMLRQIGRHYEVAGDNYLIGDVPDADSKKDADWLIAAACETKFDEDSKTWKVDDESFVNPTLAIRLWRPHPRRRRLSDSPSRAVLPILAEIDGLTKHVAAQIDSRLAGAGLLLVPNDLTFGTTENQAPEVTVLDENGDPKPAAPSRSQPDELVRMLIDVMSAAIADRADPSALVPIVLQGDGEAIKNVRFVTFATDLDAKAIELRTEAIRRLALGLDMPPEILTGTSDMNHWSSWQVEEAALKAHTEPLLAEICAALTVGYLRPALEGLGRKGLDPTEFTIIADTSDLRVRPNRSQEAIELYDRGAVSLETMVRENGFDVETDVMDDEERVIWFLTKIAGGSATPDQVQAALVALGVRLEITPGMAGDTQTTRGDQVREDIRVDEPNPEVLPEDAQPVKPEPGRRPGYKQPVQPAQAPRQTRPTPSLEKHPTRSAPDAKKAAETRALAQASAVMVHRALERAGNKVKSAMRGAPVDPATGEKAAAASIYRFVALDSASMPEGQLLEDAWGAVTVFADDLGVDAAWLEANLDAFARDLLASRRPLRVDELEAYLAAAAALV